MAADCSFSRRKHSALCFRCCIYTTLLITDPTAEWFTSYPTHAALYNANQRGLEDGAGITACLEQYRGYASFITSSIVITLVAVFALSGVGLWSLACWDAGFESRSGHGYLSVVSVVCQVEVSASGWSLVQKSPTECSVSACDREASTTKSFWSTTGCRDLRQIFHFTSAY